MPFFINNRQGQLVRVFQNAFIRIYLEKSSKKVKKILNLKIGKSSSRKAGRDVNKHNAVSDKWKQYHISSDF